MPRSTPSDYESKFADFIQMCADCRKSGVKQVLVASPSTIGDNYAEVIESLSRLAEAGLSLNIASPEQPPQRPKDVSQN